MPEISRFFGIVITMYFDDHSPPHFHARYNEYNAVIAIDTLAVLEGTMKGRPLGWVIDWASQHQAELREAWDRAAQFASPGKIEPLQ
jgi:hypothetical protein